MTDSKKLSSNETLTCRYAIKHRWQKSQDQIIDSSFVMIRFVVGEQDTLGYVQLRFTSKSTVALSM